MASTTVLEHPQPALRTIKLPSGQTVTPRSELAIESDEIPIIDVSCVWTHDLEAKKTVAEQVREASCRIGFFYAKGHVRKCPPSRYSGDLFVC